MSDMRNLEALLDGIREELSRIRLVIEQDAYKKQMTLQKVRDENDNTKLF